MTMSPTPAHAAPFSHRQRRGTRVNMSVRRSFVVVSVFVVGALAVGCEPEVGQPCDPNTKEVLSKVKVAPGTNDLVKDVSFNVCSTALCASIDGSRPFCTKQCEADVECAEAGEGFTCQVVVDFGALACEDFTPADECDESGAPPCDCITEDGPSQRPLKYCAASAETIAARDVEFGRPPFRP